MRPIAIILAVLVATQPVLSVVGGGPCGDSACGVSPERGPCCAKCPTSAAPSCCCAQPGDEPPPTPEPSRNPDDALRGLLAGLFIITAAVVIDVLDEPATSEAQGGPGVVASELTHNERLALRCISRT